MAYRILWAPLFGCALIGATFGTWATARLNLESGETWYPLGIRLNIDRQRVQVVPLFPAMEGTGLRSDSRLVAIDGHRLTASGPYSLRLEVNQALRGSEGTVHVLQLVTQGGAPYDVALTVRRANLAEFDRPSAVSFQLRATIFAVTAGFSYLLFLCGAALLFIRRVREPVAALLSLGFLVLVAGNASIGLGIAPLADLLQWIDPSAPLLGISLLLFPAGRFEPRWVWAAMPVVLLGWLTPLFFAPAVPTTLNLLTIAATVAANVVRYLRLDSAIERLQVRWAMLGIGSSMVLLALQNILALIQPNVANVALNVSISFGANLLLMGAVACLVGGLLVSLLRYRLYDADSLLSRSAVYGALAIAMIAVFAGTEKLAEILAEEYWGESIGGAAGAIAAGLAAAVIPLFHHRIERWAERRFQGPLLTLRDELPEDLRDWRETDSAAELAARGLQHVVRALHSKAAAIVTSGPDSGTLASVGYDGIAPAVLGEALPLSVELGPLPGGGEAFLLIGPRPDGSPPGPGRARGRPRHRRSAGSRARSRPASV